MPKCSCSYGTFLKTFCSQTTPSAKSSKQTHCPADLSPKAKSRSWEVSCRSCTPSPGSPPLSDSAPPRDSITCVAVAGSDLNPWRPGPGPQRGWSPHSSRSLIWTGSGESSLLLSWGSSFSTASVVLLYRFSISVIYSFIYMFCMYLYVQYLYVRFFIKMFNPSCYF